MEFKANPTPSSSWYLDNKELGDSDARFITKMEKKSIDTYILNLEILVNLSI